MQALIPMLANVLRILIVKLLSVFGIAFVTYQGYEVALDKFKSYIESSMSSMPVDIANLLLMAGFGEGLGYIFGALAFSISMNAINKFTLAFSKGS